MTYDKENAQAGPMTTTTGAPASSLMMHLGKRESFLSGAATGIAAATTKGAVANKLSKQMHSSSNSNLAGLAPRTQQVVSGKAVGLLSIQQMQQQQAKAPLQTQNAAAKGTAALRQKTASVRSAQGSSNGVAFQAPAKKSAYRPGLNYISNAAGSTSTGAAGRSTDNERKAHVRQFKSLSQIQSTQGGEGSAAGRTNTVEPREGKA